MDDDTKGRFDDVGCLIALVFVFLLATFVYAASMIDMLFGKIEDLENNCQCIEEVVKGDQR